MMAHRVKTKDRIRRMKKMKNGKLQMFIKRIVPMKTTTTMTTKIIIVDHGRFTVFFPKKIIEFRGIFSSPDDRMLDSREHDSKRKRMTPISTKDQLKSMILSRFRMEK